MWKEPERFDIISFFDDETDKIQLKRIIALPGETLQIRGGEVYINGSLWDLSRYIGDRIEISGRAGEEIFLEEDEYFVLGDNTFQSQDSRFEDPGNIKRGQIHGKAWAAYEPLLKIRFLNRQPHY